MFLNWGCLREGGEAGSYWVAMGFYSKIKIYCLFNT